MLAFKTPCCAACAAIFLALLLGACPQARAKSQEPAVTPAAAESDPALVPAPEVKPNDSVFAQPPELDRDVRFWIRVYTEVTTEQGLLHDDWNLGIVYEVLRFDAGASPRERERVVTAAKARYASLLRRFAAGDTENLTAHEQRILHAFGPAASPAVFRDSIDRIRFQLGQADRFPRGVTARPVF